MKQIKLRRRILLIAVLLLGVAITQYPDWHYRVFSSEPTSLSTDLPNAVFLQRTLQGHWATVYYLTFSPDGQILASASQDNTIKLWNLATGQELRTLKEPHLDIDRPIAFSPDGQKLAVSSSDNPTSEHIVIKLWDVNTGQELSIPDMPIFYALAFSPDGQTIASSIPGNPIGIGLWNLKTGKELLPLKAPFDTFCHSLAFSPDGKIIAYGSANSTAKPDQIAIKLWDVNTGKELRTLKMAKKSLTPCFAPIAFSPDGQILAATLALGSGTDNTIKMWDLATGKEILTFKEQPKPVLSFAFSSNGKLLVSGGGGNIRMWNLATGQQIPVLKEHSDTVLSIAFSPNGQTLAASNGNQIEIWQLRYSRKLD